MEKEYSEKTFRAFRKKLIRATKCTAGETYYLTGMFWDYGDLLTVGVAKTLTKALGGEMPEVEYKKPRCLINTPVKFNGKVPAVRRGVMGIRSGFEFEMDGGEKIYANAHTDFFKKPNKNDESKRLN